MSARIKFVTDGKTMGDRVAAALTIQKLREGLKKPAPKTWHDHVMTDAPPVPPKPKKDDHIRATNDLSTFFCRHCGDHYTVALPISITMLNACVKAFKKDHLRCKKTQKGFACGWCFDFGHEPDVCPRVIYHGDPQRWREGPDTGASSITIWKYMTYGVTSRPDLPADPDDFGRCYRLLKAFPEWRKRIGEMSAVEGWKQLSSVWDELEALYEEELPSGRCPKLAERMRELGL